MMILDQPATATELAAGLNLTVGVVEHLLAELQREYSGYTVKAPDMDDASVAGFSSSPRGFELRSIAGGWRIYSRSDFA
ncbi:MAG: segregation and condensation protein B, partial [Cellulosimicrobium cellulans]